MFSVKKFIFPVLLFLISQQISAQNRIPLNRHFFEIADLDTEPAIYTRLQNKSETEETVVYIFDQKNRKVSQTKIGLNAEDNFNEELTENFDSAGNHISTNLLNLDNSKYLTEYFDKGQKKAQVLYRGDNTYEIWRNNPESAYTTDHDDFKPSTDRDELNQFLAKNLKYPQTARNVKAEGTVMVGVLVSELGEVREVELANEVQVHRDLGKEAVRVIKLFKGPFKPALNLEGQPIEAWIYIPIRFKLS
ncbi:MAG TPA: energy transducer TonB [Algoriphagus sp.]|nr:energy transducer TonB [Algoriphagus sp.]